MSGIQSTALNTSASAVGLTWSGAPVYTSASGFTVYSPGASSTNSTTSFVDIINYTGAGYVDLLAQYIAGNTYTGTLEVIIDGVTILANTDSTANVRLLMITGAAGAVGSPMYIYPTSPIYFNASLQIRHKVSNAACTSIVHVHVVKTR